MEKTISKSPKFYRDYMPAIFVGVVSIWAIVQIVSDWDKPGYGIIDILSLLKDCVLLCGLAYFVFFKSVLKLDKVVDEVYEESSLLRFRRGDKEITIPLDNIDNIKLLPFSIHVAVALKSTSDLGDKLYFIPDRLWTGKGRYSPAKDSGFCKLAARIKESNE